jgi:cytidylate kinase
MGAEYGAGPASIPGESQRASDELRGLIRSVIEDTAINGSAVILAHAGSLALAGRDDVLRVLVTASPKTRAQRLASASGMDEKHAAHAIKQSDAGRADYIKRFYSISVELPTHYDLVINTDRLTPEHATGLIVEATGRAPRGIG